MAGNTPTPPEVLRRAFAAHQAGNAAEAERLYKRVLRAVPDQFDALHLLGVLEAARGRYERADQLIGRALKVSPRAVEALNNHGNVLWNQKRYEEAAVAYDKALAIQPLHVVALNNRGNVLHQKSRYEEALDSYENALAIQPNYAEALSNRGDVLVDLRRFDEALASYGTALEAKPDFAQAHFNASHCRLLIGDFARGWLEHEWRWKIAASMPPRRSLTKPLWLGEMDLSGKTILLHAEQGLGDTLQFCRYAAMVAAGGARIILEVQSSLKSLLRSLGGVDLVIARGEPLPPFDVHCPLMSLPLAFNTSIGTIPSGVPYLTADPDLVSVWRERSRHLQGKKIGIAWAGNPRAHDPQLHLADRRRSMRLSQFAPITRVPGAVLISLQKGEPAQQARMPPDGMELIDWTSELRDFADTAALVETLDLVISVDTSVVHLAAALGKPVWVLNRFDTCWRWLLNRDDSPWYPTLRLFRQPRPGDWDSVMEQVVAELTRLAA